MLLNNDSFCLSVCLPACLSVYLYVCLSVHQTAVCLVFLWTCCWRMTGRSFLESKFLLFSRRWIFRPSVHPSVHPSVRLSGVVIKYLKRLSEPDICNISTFICLKLALSLLCMMLSCVPASSQMFKLREICHFIPGNASFCLLSLTSVVTSATEWGRKSANVTKTYFN